MLQLLALLPKQSGYLRRVASSCPNRDVCAMTRLALLPFLAAVGLGDFAHPPRSTRRLQQSDLLDAACLITCPGAIAMAADIMSFSQTNPPNTDNLAELGDALSDTIGAMLQAMCKHSSAMVCVVENCVETNTTAGDISLQALAQFMPCVCEACTGFASLISGLASTAASVENISQARLLLSALPFLCRDFCASSKGVRRAWMGHPTVGTSRIS